MSLFLVCHISISVITLPYTKAILSFVELFHILPCLSFYCGPCYMDFAHCWGPYRKRLQIVALIRNNWRWLINDEQSYHFSLFYIQMLSMAYKVNKSVKHYITTTYVVIWRSMAQLCVIEALTTYQLVLCLVNTSGTNVMLKWMKWG